jgi:hypothetical protein
MVLTVFEMQPCGELGMEAGDTGFEDEATPTEPDVTPTVRSPLDRFEYLKLDDGVWWEDDD